MRFIALLLVTTVLTTPAVAATINVGSGESIQSAVNRAQAGDEIVVDDGTYDAFEINKNGISVRARNPGGAHVVASGNNQPAIAAYSQSDIAVRGFRLTSRNGDGVKIGGDASGPLAKNIVFEGNTTEYAKLDGFKFFHSDGITMRNNVIKMAGGGGAAGSDGNSNGDGGIDWVRVSNSLMEGNTVQQTNGWACAMVKNGSNNNRIINNSFNNCEVNGIDMAAGSSGRSAAANKSGMTAYNNTIEGNVISGGKGCAVKFGQKTRGNQLGDNDINGRQCDKGTGNNGVAAGADDEVGADYSGGDSDYGANEDYGGDSGMSMDLASSVGSSGCSSAEMDMAMGAASGIAGVFTGGRATVAAQYAQQIQLMMANVCASEQNDKLQTSNENEERLIDYERRANAHGQANNSAGINSAMGKSMNTMGQGGFLTTERQIGAEVDELYPDAFPDMDPDSLIAYEQQSRMDERAAHVFSFQAQNRMVQEQAAGVERSRIYAAQGRAGEGIRSELQAANAINGELVASVNMQTNAMVANHRAMSETRLRDEAKKQAANETAQTFMSSLSRCDDCKMSKPLLAN